MEKALLCPGAAPRVGNPVPFESIYGLDYGQVYSYCLRKVKNPVDAEDVTQDAFLQLIRKIETFRGESAFYTWVRWLVANLVLMHFRRNSRREILIDDVTSAKEETTKRSNQDQTVNQTENVLVDRLNLERAISRLSPSARTAIF